MIVNVAVKKFGYLYQRLGSWLPWQVVEKIKLVGCVLMSPFILSTAVYGYGGSFKSFLRSKDCLDEINALKEGLDPQSLELLDLFLSRALNFPEFPSQMQLIPVLQGVFTKKELEEAAKWFKLQRKCLRRWKYNDFYPVSSFFYHNGLKNMPQAVLDYIRGKDFLDLGAYIGDSVLVFQEYQPHKIIAFEASYRNAERFWKTIQQNKIAKESTELIVAGVSDCCGKVKINDTGLDDVNIKPSGETEIDLITIDEFSEQRGSSLDIGLIKMDIEGFGLAAVKGMTETLKRHRPVLSLAIYHNPDEFFKIKPLIASFNLNYRFAIRKFSQAHLTTEIYLLAWPAELGVSACQMEVGVGFMDNG